MSEKKNLEQRRASLSPEMRRRLAERLRGRKKPRAVASGSTASTPGRGTIARAAGDGAAPLSFAQQRLWFLDQLDPGSPHYNVPGAVALRGRLDAGALERCLGAVIERHESLRTIFRHDRDADPAAGSLAEPQQIVLEAAPSTLPQIDLGTLGDEDGGAESERLALQLARWSFDLARGPLMISALLRLSDEHHVLLLIQHHIVSDGWSVEVLIRDLTELYRAARSGEVAALPALPIRYRDFALWQRQNAGEAMAADLEYWRRQLADLPAILALPTDRPRPRQRAMRGRRIALSLEPEVTAALRRLGKSERATAFLVLLSAWVALLHRFTGQHDVVVGSPIAGRQQPELRDLVGFFVNTLALRGELRGRPSFRQLLDRMRQVVLDAFAHQSLPFEKLVEVLRPERDTAQTPIFQVLFSLREKPGTGSATSGLEVEELPIDTGSAKFDLTFEWRDLGDTLAGELEFDRDLFDDATAERLARSYLTLLRGALAEPAQAVADLPLLDREQRQLLSGFSRSPSADLTVDGDATFARTLDRLVAERAAEFPHRPAVSDAGRVLSFAELDARGNQLAHHLRAAGIAGESAVGVLLERSLEQVIALLGVLKAGAFYVPLDPALPSRRLQQMIDEASMPVLLTRAGLGADLESARRVEVDGERAQLERAPRAAGTWGDEAAGADRLAYVIFTSGSTGRPKGVMVPHRGLVHLVAWHQRTFGALPDDRASQVAGLGFDVAAWELWAHLSAGVGVHLVTEDARIEVSALVDWLRRERITLAFLPTTVAELALRQRWPEDTAIRALFTAGDRLHGGLTRERPPFFNLYGPTETSVLASGGPVGDELEPTIGRPLGRLRIHLLDARLQPVPVGVAGELMIGGVALARGYLGRPAHTARAFIPDPLAAKPGERLYRSGDLARWRADGELIFIGRFDHQVKIRGFRIELGEIEAALDAHPAVEQVAVLAHPGDGDPRLVAYLAASGEQVVPALRAELRKRLPEYMVPAHFEVLAQLPVNANGKIDRNALLQRDLPSLAPATYVAARDPIEETLAGIWSTALGVERVGIYDNFFDLGGHSLLATKVVAAARQVFGVEVPVRQVFASPTIAELARYVERARRNAPASEPLPLVPCERHDEMPLSPFQERLWFLDQFDPATATLNIPVALRLEGELDPALLARAVERVVERHEALRLSFGARRGTPFQRLVSRLHVALPLVDLTALEPADRDREVGRLNGEESRRPFDLQSGPLLRLLTLRAAAQQHVVLLNLHHIISDGWSLQVFARELGQHYGALLQDTGAGLEPLPIQYLDFVAWQRRWLASEAKEHQLEYWLQRFSTLPAALELPTDRPRPAVLTYRGERVQKVLPAELSGRLRRLGKERGATLFMTLLAGVEVLLSRLAGETDLVIGTPIAGRNRAEVADLIGYFSNNLALRTDLAGEPTFVALLDQVRDVAFDAYSHQELPFEHLLEVLQPERELSHTPLFQVFFNLLDAEWSSLELPGLKIEFLDLPEPPSKFDLVFYVKDAASGIVFDLVYNADLFDRQRIELMLDQLAGLFEQVAADPRRPITEYSLVTPSMQALLPDPRAELDVTWLGTVFERFRAVAASRPQHPAVIEPHRTWTYGELLDHASRLAHHLHRSGLGAGDVVAIWCERSAHLVSSLLGVLGSGAAFVVIDPAHPMARLRHIVRLARPRAWIELGAGETVPPQLAELLEASGDGPRLRFGDDLEPLAEEPAKAPEVEIGADDLAYLAFTSGTTGVPKGIRGRHGSLTHFTPFMVERFGFTAADRFSMLSALSHDPLHRDLFTPLQIGATVVIPDSERMGEPGWLASWLGEQRISVAHLTPSLAQLITGEAEEGSRAADLRHVFFLGEALRWRDLLGIWALAPDALCCNLYGATETQRASAYHQRAAADAARRGHEILPVGRGMRDIQILILNGDRPAGVGELGELCFRSPHLALGYLDDPELDAARFTASPFSDRPEDRLYRTGDLGRYLPDGDAFYHGRADRQVKIRGFRIELGEIESVFSHYPGLRAAAVEDWTIDGECRLAAYLVPEGEDGPDLENLRTWLGERLPAYMMPAAFEILAALPLKANGELDRPALPEPDWMKRSGGTFVAPRNALEERLAAIWSEVLGVERVGVHDNFFHLGGHSLLATQVVARVRDALQVELPLRDLFETPTLAALAPRLAQAETATATEPIERVERSDDLELSIAQQRLWFIDQLRPGSPANNVPTILEIEGALDLGVLRHSLAELVRRHETLRTIFTSAEGQPVQRVQPPFAPQTPIVDLSSLAAADRERESERRRADRWLQPFDLTRGPLLHCTLLRHDDRRHTLMLVLHHIIFDGWSLAVLMQDLGALYRAFSEGRPSPLAELEIQYADFARWQNRWMQRREVRSQLDYWLERLAGHPAALELPTDRQRPAYQTFRGGQCPVEIDAALNSALTALAQEHRASLFMVLLGAFQTVLMRHTEQHDVVLGSPVAGRGRAEVEGLIGMFFNLLALRGDLSGNPTFRALLERSREVALGAFAHQDLPFEHLLDELQPERHLNRAPLFQVTLVLQNAPLRPLELPQLTVTPVAPKVAAAHFDLNLQLVETEGRLSGSLAYKEDLFDATTIERLGRHLENLLRGGAENPDTRLWDLPLLSAAEQHQLAGEWNDTAAAWPQLPASRREETLVSLFSTQVARDPGAVAVICGGRELSYGELDSASNRLAHALRRRGVGLGTLVGVHLSRAAEMVTAVLGVLKAGGAYVPIETSLPAERVRWLLDSLALGCLLTQSRHLDTLARLEPVPTLEHVFCLDPGAAPDADRLPWVASILGSAELEDASSAALGQLAGPGDLAYIIFTSGSTGRPKGVTVRHEPAARLIDWVLRTFDFTPRDRVLFITSLSFDLSVFDIFGLLAAGGSVRIASAEELEDPRALVAALRDEPITFWDSAPAALRQLVPCFPAAGELSADDHHLRMVFLSGDWIPLALPDQVREAFPGSAVTSLGGATEATVWSNFHRVDEVLPQWLSIPYGRPMDNARYHVLDRALRPCPIGVEGDLYIGGRCLSAGYFGDERLTAEKFLPDPFAGKPFAEEAGGRIYATGDRVRAWRDGTLEFLGRRDFQVKIRGFRIELGEIEAALAEHPEVRDAVVLAHTVESPEAPAGQPSRDRRLAAYVVPDTARLAERAQRLAASESATETVEQWESVYDGIYGQNPEPVDPTFNIVGWNSSYSGQPLAAEEMREWLDNTVREILALEPKRVLELGCGTGMLLYAIAPHCEVYHATDLSEVSLRSIRRHLDTLDEDFSHVELLHRAADEWEGFAAGDYDAVILNSVSQHFPSADYLASVVEGACRTVADGGFVFVGDIRNHALLEAFYASIELHQATDSMQLSQLAQRCRQRVMQEEELLVDPTFWHALPGRLPRCRGAEVRLKRGRYQNEMTRFRYSAVLRVGDGELEPLELPWRDASDLPSVAALERLLREEAPGLVGLRGVANARLARPVKILEKLARPSALKIEQVREKLTAESRSYGLDPEEVWQLAEELGYEIEITWSQSGDPGSFDAGLRRRSDGAALVEPPLAAYLVRPEPEERPLSERTNHPGLGVQIRALVPRLRERLQQTLPAYMMPGSFMLLDALPVTANGKLDRRALPMPEAKRSTAPLAPTVPRGRTEDLLCEVIARVLGLEQVGIHDNFFELGGDSILSIQAVARAQELGIRISPRQLFQHQTIAELASVAELVDGAATDDRPLTGPLPLMPIQRWFFEQRQPEAHHWNLALLFELRQDLEPDLMQRAAAELSRHHDSLRLRFHTAESGSTGAAQWQQEYAPAGDPPPVAVFDLEALAPSSRGTAFDRLAASTQASLDLGDGPLWRLVLVRFSREEPMRLLIVVHHLVIDGVSWRILLGDLQTLYRQLAGGGAAQLPPKTTSYRDWAQRMVERATSEKIVAELPYWLAQQDAVDEELPLDTPREWQQITADPSLNLEGSARLVSLSLDAEDTRFLLQEMPELFRAQIQEVLLTALVLAFERWRSRPGLRLELEGHGREDLFEEVDLSRTVGWFTAIYPLVLDPGSSDPGTALNAVKDQLRAVPGRGLGYGLLRYLAPPESADRIRQLPQARVIFNYLGQFDEVVGESGMLRPADASPGRIRSPRAHRLHQLEVYSWVHRGELRVDFEYSTDLNQRSTIDALAGCFGAALNDLIDHARGSDEGSLSPSDFPEAELSQEDLDSLISQLT